MLPYELHQNFQLDMAQVLDTIVEEISELSDEPFVLIFDEYDRSDDANDINRFVEYLADRIPEHCTLVINSRTLPRLPWLAMIAKKQAVIIQDDQLIKQDIHGPHQHKNYNLEVFALGPGFVRLNGNQVDTWEGHLPRLLFFYALDRPVVTRAEICDAFWPNLDIDQAVNVFHVTKRRLHKALDLDVLLHIENYYQINPELTVYYDIVDFVETLMRGRYSEGEDQFSAWQHAVELYRGPFLQGHDETWIMDRRKAMRTGYLEAVMGMARTYVDRGKGETALKLYRSALDEDFSREDLHRELMLLYNELGRRGEAVAHFQQLEKAFNEQDVTLSPQTIEVYNNIMA
jgi:two-component SAPR family response regulator